MFQYIMDVYNKIIQALKSPKTLASGPNTLSELLEQFALPPTPPLAPPITRVARAPESCRPRVLPAAGAAASVTRASRATPAAKAWPERDDAGDRVSHAAASATARPLPTAASDQMRCLEHPLALGLGY
jgi:hypothetical protein